jgi:CheY-like chemotaxis protein/predicted regulator of Ras-like GTPase activity (Roadblock/LC7/MglB family)
MSDVWRIFVVDGEENSNHIIVNALRRDGYFVQSVLTGAEAMRILWSEVYDVVICDVKTPGANGFELLQWVKTYRPNAYTMLIGDVPASEMSGYALEAGAVSYLEKPLDLGFLREELRRVLEQTGFSADLDSFDLLDVIQMITLSRRSIALLVNAGLEERGLLRFLNGELIWAEYGALRGEEAFFALAAHKNGSVIQQPWSGGEMKNVTQPLSRLILQALQYRTKYAHPSARNSESAYETTAQDEFDDSPFMTFPDDPQPPAATQPTPTPTAASQQVTPPESTDELPWWENTAQLSRWQEISDHHLSVPMPDEIAPTIALGERHLNGNGQRRDTTLPPVPDTPVHNDPELPSWLTDLPTSAHLPALQADIPNRTAHGSNTPTSSSPAWPTSPQISPVTDRLLPRSPGEERRGASTSSPGWQQPQPAEDSSEPAVHVEKSYWTFEDGSEKQADENHTARNLYDLAKQGHNYPAFVSALQTLGYSLEGFIAAAVVDMQGQSIAQVALDDMDIAQVCKPFSRVLLGMSQTLALQSWGECQQLMVTSAERRVFMYVVGEERKAFLVLVTTRDADPDQCLRLLENVEGAIEAALH